MVSEEREITNINKELLSLDLNGVSVEELEQRLELAIAFMALGLGLCANHICGDYTCGGVFDACNGFGCDGFLCRDFSGELE